jgi:hypothetical protein
MKKIIAIVLFCFIGLAHAEVIATLPNQAGGKIVLTNETCSSDGKVYKSLRSAYKYAKSGETSDGCWYISDEVVNAIWEDGTKNRYPAGTFTIKKQTTYQ